jgi:hypothetical protein
MVPFWSIPGPEIPRGITAFPQIRRPDDVKRTFQRDFIGDNPNIFSTGLSRNCQHIIIYMPEKMNISADIIVIHAILSTIPPIIDYFY